jgi:four helix bundle protein
MQPIPDRTFQFAIRIVKLCQHLEETGSVARTISKQLLRSGTSIGANVQEGQAGQSKADFISKNYIALKEARETLYWLKLLAATNILPESRLTPIAQEAEEITRILGATIVKAKGKSVKEKID